MNTLKKTVSALTVSLFMLLSVFFFFFSDVIYTPDLKDGAYLDDVSYSYNPYIYKVRAADGKSAQLYKTPLDKNSSGSIEDGTVFHSNTTYEKDGFWVYYENREDGDVSESGWIRGTEVARQYDSDLFKEDYAKDIKETDEGLLSFKDLKEIVLYLYPTGPEKGKLDIVSDDENLSFTQIYTDPSGNEWAYVGYYMGSWNAWVCLSHPDLHYDELHALSKDMVIETRAETYADKSQFQALPADDTTKASDEPATIQENSLTPATTQKNSLTPTTIPDTTKPSGTDTKTSTIPAIAASVGGVCVLTAAVLLLLKKKRG